MLLFGTLPRQHPVADVHMAVCACSGCVQLSWQDSTVHAEVVNDLVKLTSNYVVVRNIMGRYRGIMGCCWKKLHLKA